MTTERLDEEWQAWLCSDCDPEYDEDSEYSHAFVMLLPAGEPAPDHCPRCGSYLSMGEGSSDLHITNTPAERWARAHEGGDKNG